jgi:hypothetical protein
MFPKKQKKKKQKSRLGSLTWLGSICWPLESYIYIFIYFDDNNKIEIICLIENKL